MKKETKELIEYMYDKFADRIAITRSLSAEQRKSAEAYNTQRNKIQKFLKSLPEIEEKLCFGGYIQDYNGTPCCCGDRILHNGNLTGTLRYAKEDGVDIFPHWWFDLDDKAAAIPQFEWFEKIEK